MKSIILILTVCLLFTVNEAYSVIFRGKVISILSGQTLKWIVPENVSVVTISIYDNNGESIGSKDLRVVKNQMFIVEAK